MKQYFQENDALPQAEHEIHFNHMGRDFVFRARRGLFSCKSVDNASAFLITSIPKMEGRLLDLGCGYGAVGIVLAAVYGTQLYGLDINAYAVEMARKNAAANNVKGVFFVSDGFQNVDMTFDAIVLNPPVHAGNETIQRMFASSSRHLSKGGVLYTVIQKKHGAKSWIRKLEGIFACCKVLARKKGAYALELRTEKCELHLSSFICAASGLCPR